jgi:hypothetical protein
MHAYEIRPRKDNRGFELISDVLPFRSALVFERARCNRLRTILQPIT